MKCGQKTCDLDAVGGFLWPSEKGPLPACLAHLIASRSIALHLGCTIAEFTLEQMKDREAAIETIDMLKGSKLA